MTTTIYEIANLPLTTHSQEKRLFSLSYTSTSESGIFFYGTQKLQFNYIFEETRITNTFPDGKTRKTINPIADAVPCNTWINDFGDWQIAGNEVFSSGSRVDRDTEVARRFIYYSGFGFDDKTGLWKCQWKQEDRQEVFNSTFEYVETVELELNLADMIGHYFEYKYVDISS